MKQKNRYGQYFTEPVMADFMVSLIRHPHDARILEPSCGKGVFLDKLADYGFGDVSAYEIDKSLSCAQPFVRYESFVSSPLSEKYDVVIGNPPYIRWKNLEKELKDELLTNSLWNRFFNSLCDYLFIFILKSIEQLNDGGELVFICSDYWMNTTHSQTLRNYMCQNGYFERIYHFKEAPLFEKVCASFVIFRYIKSAERKPAIELFSYNQRGKPTKEELTSGTCFTRQEIPQFAANRRWLFATEEVQRDLDAFENACIKEDNLFASELSRLGDVCDIGNGMVSGMDAAFKVRRDEEIQFNENERKCLINVLKAKNLNSYTYLSSDKYIYVPSDISEETFNKEYPHFASHFEPHRDGLSKRYSYGRDLPYWEFAFPRSKSLFERKCPKIFIPCKERISHKSYFRFCYSPEGFYPLQDVTGIVPKKECRETVEYVLAYLNLPCVFVWLKYNGIVKGEIVEFSESPIASIPYMRIDWKNERETSLHDNITWETKQYLQDKDERHREVINNLFNQLFYEKSKL
ncbi:MAG: N-6 DNA methylase [Bacteroidaceae bacterium]|nr:N-6 DNA methylase [Bacteroidaceae bacterium]